MCSCNSNAVDNAFLKQPKITKPVIKAMCAATKQTYLENELDINFFNVVDGLVVNGLAGSSCICYRVVLTQEMANINDALLGTVNRLKTIVWQVNTMMKNKRDAVLLFKEYGNAISLGQLSVATRPNKPFYAITFTFVSGASYHISRSNLTKPQWLARAKLSEYAIVIGLGFSY